MFLFTIIFAILLMLVNDTLLTAKPGVPSFRWISRVFMRARACACVRVRARARDLMLVLAQVRRRVVSLHVKTLKVVKYYRNNKQ